MSENDQVAAIIVTFNRLGELKRALARLRQQTRKLDEIIVVDDGSADGTRGWLAAQRDVVVIHQANLGPGVGFGVGLKTAIRRGAEWCWCLDDDVCAAPNALEELCKAIELRPDARVFNSISLAENNPGHFAVGGLNVRTNPEDFLFGRSVRTLDELLPYLDANGMVDSIGGHFYHGSLLHRSVVETVGVPVEWMFIRGEEVEYTLRIMQCGYHIFSVARSVVYHPEIPGVTLRVFAKSKSFKTSTAQKRYYDLRNIVWIRRTYYAGYPLLPYLARRLGGALLTELMLIRNKPWRERLACSRAAVRGLWDGWHIRAPNESQPG